ncbi:MAG: hypothetical protein D6701_10965, partial [Gemmatimonadetes bacterium]
AAAQRTDEFRVGITLGGIGLVGVDFEFRSGNRSLDVNVATFDFRDVSVSVVGKQYFGGAEARPFLGIGLWGVTSFQAEGTGFALLARAPVGLDWRVEGGDHFLGMSIAVNRALLKHDPEDDTRPVGRLVPLPGFYYKVQP